MPSESLTWQLCPVVRASFHAVLHSGIDAVSLAAAMQEFSQTVEGLRQAHQLLTASLFRYQAHLFLYLESVGTALAPDGACQAAVLPRRWWSLTPPFQLFPLRLAAQVGVFFSAALSVGSLRPAVSRHPALWSPDFPHACCKQHIARPSGPLSSARV